MISELDLLLIRQREHEIARLKLLLFKRKIIDQCPKYMSDKIERDIFEVEQAQILTMKTLEQQGHDYLTITAEMARIRAEVRGEK